MNTNRIQTALRELRAEETELRKNVDSLRDSLKEAQAELTHVSKAISTLTGKAQTSPQSQKPTATKEEVIRDIVAFLEPHGPTAEPELKAHVEQQAASRGQSRTGLAMRFKNALKDSLFSHANGRISLAAVPDSQSQT